MRLVDSARSSPARDLQTAESRSEGIHLFGSLAVFPGPHGFDEAGEAGGLSLSRWRGRQCEQGRSRQYTQYRREHLGLPGRQGLESESGFFYSGGGGKSMGFRPMPTP